MSTPVRQRASKKVSALKLVPRAKSPKPSRYVSGDVDASHFTPMGPSNVSLNSTMLESDVYAYITFKECEEDALLAIEAGRQRSFTRIIMQSPSLYTFRLGDLYAAKMNWCDALKSFLSEIQSSRSPVDKSDNLREHRLYREYFRQDKADFYSCLTSPTFLEEFALLKAAVEGSVEVVHLLVEFIGPNFGDMFDKPFMEYVYMNKDRESRRSCLQAILPNLEPTDGILGTVAGNGDLPTLMYLVDKMKGVEHFMCVTAALEAIENGHNEVAQWIALQPGLIPWKRHARSVVLAAIKAQNLDLLVFFSNHMPELRPYDLGFYTISALWKYLKDKDQALYRKFAPTYPDGYTSPLH